MFNMQDPNYYLHIEVVLVEGLEVVKRDMDLEFLIDVMLAILINVKIHT